MKTVSELWREMSEADRKALINRLFKPQSVTVIRGRNDHRARRFVQHHVQGSHYLVGDVEVNGQWHYTTVRRDRVEVLG